jgi:serine/threonine protein kinase
MIRAPPESIVVTISPGARLSHYEIVAPIGSGGMGEVYRARDVRLDRTVALKVLSARARAQPELRERFDREARAIARFNHPHVCALYDIGSDDGVDFLIMEQDPSGRMAHLAR